MKKIAELNRNFDVVNMIDAENADEQVKSLRANSGNGQRYIILDETDQEYMESDQEKRQYMEELLDEQLEEEQDETGGLSLAELGLSLDVKTLDDLKKLQEALKEKQKQIRATMQAQKKVMSERLKEARKVWWNQIVYRTVKQADGEYSGMYGVFQTPEETEKKDLSGYVMMMNGKGDFDDDHARKTYQIDVFLRGEKQIDLCFSAEFLCHAAFLKHGKEKFCQIIAA